MTQDDYFWIAHYADQTSFDELDPDGVARPFSAIDQSNLAAFEVVAVKDGRSFVVPVSHDRRVIFFRRRRIETTMDGDEIGRSTVTCIGWQKTTHGRNTQSFLFLFPDGSSVLTDDRSAV